MLNYIWVVMILLGVFWGLATGRLENVTEAVISSSEEGVQLAFVLLGVMCLWSGLMQVAQKSGLIKSITKLTKDFFAGLFNVPDNHPTIGAIVLSFASIFAWKCGYTT